MDSDVDMDAPQISTLRDEPTPPPPPTPAPAPTTTTKAVIQLEPAVPGGTGKFRIKLVAREVPVTTSRTRPSQNATSSRAPEEEEDEDEQEDQLIDDEEEGMKPLPPRALHSHSHSRGTASESPPKKKSPAKRKAAPRKSEREANKRHAAAAAKETKDAKDTKEDTITMDVANANTNGAPNLAPTTLSWFVTKPGAKTRQEPGPSSTAAGAESVSASHPPSDSPPKAGGKKKAATKRAPAKSRASQSVAKLPRVNLLVADDAQSESGLTGTATSSPLIPTTDLTPEPLPHPPPPSSSTLSLPPPSLSHSENPPPPSSETTLPPGPIPIYTLPSKPFPVQPPIKIPTGFAPALPLDRTPARPRRWREARREIRGVGGGRWFVRAWVGRGESEYVNAVVNAQGVGEEGRERERERGAAVAVGGGVKGATATAPGGRSKSAKAKGTSLAASVSAGPSSRSASAIPEPHTSSTAPRAPTKMRNTHLPAEGGDVEMVDG